MEHAASTSPTYTFVVGGDRTLTAVFEEIPLYTVSVGVGPEQEGFGTASGAGSYREGASVTVTAQAAEGYKFSAWQEDGQTVSEDAEYTFTVTGDRALVAVFAKFSRLPEGYTEVAYIEADGKSYIDTGVNPRYSASASRAKIAMDVEPLDAPTSTNKYFAYSKSTFTSSGTTYTLVIAVKWSTSNGAYGQLTTSSGGNPSLVSTSAVTDTTPRRMQVELDAKSKTFSTDGTTVSMTTRALFLNTNHTNWMLFGPSGTSATNKIHARLYSCQIYNGADLPLVRDFIPCTDPSGAVGLYDLVDGKFYGNSGTGTLTAGPAV